MNETCDFKMEFTFPNITYFHSFIYEKGHFLAFRYYNIGTGKKLLYKNLCVNPEKLKKKVKDVHLTIEQESLIKSEYNYATKSSNLKLFSCNKCSFVSACKNSLKEHNFIHLDLTDLDQLAQIKMEYSKLVNGFRNTHISTTKQFKVDNAAKLEVGDQDLTPKGYGLQFITRNRFTPKQIKFLTDIFNNGEKNGIIRTPKSVHSEMKSLTGTLFTFEERLTIKQIKSYFGSLKQKQRNQSKIKKVEEEEEGDEEKDGIESENDELEENLDILERNVNEYLD